MQDLAAELKLEICSYSEVHDQLAMRRVCKRWRSNLSEVCLSRYVDIHASKIPNQPEKAEKPQDHYPCISDSRYGYWTVTGWTSEDVFTRGLPQWYDARTKYDDYLTVTENRLEHALNQHLQKNTKVLVLRNVAFERSQFGVVAKVIKEKQANLMQLILKGCQEQEEDSAYWWLNTQHPAMRDLISVTRRLILDNYMMRNVLGRAIPCWEMPCSISESKRLRGGNRIKKVPLILARHEFDRSKPLSELYPSFIMALNANCPEVSPEIRNDVVILYSSWKQSDVYHRAWQFLGIYVKSLNEGMYVSDDFESVFDISAVQQLDPLTLNKLTIEALHRMYCLPGQRYSASTNVVVVHADHIG